LSYALSFVALFSAVASLGLDSVIAREMVGCEQETPTILGTSLLLKFGGSTLAAGIIWIATEIIDHDASINVLIIIITTGLLFNPLTVFESFFQARVLSKYTAFAQMVSFAAHSVFQAVLVFSGAPLFWFALSNFLNIALTGVLLAGCYRYQGQTLTALKVSGGIAKSLLSDSWPLILSGLAIMVFMKIDQVMIKSMMSSESVGIYSIAVRLSETWHFVPNLIVGSIFPAIVNARRDDLDRFNRRMQQLFNMMGVMAYGIAIPLTLFSKEIISVLFGVQYLDASMVLNIHVWSGVFVFFGIAHAPWVIIEGRSTLILYRTLGTALLNVLLNLLLIPQIGINGAAIATLISCAISSYFFDLITKCTYRAFAMKTRALFLADLFFTLIEFFRRGK